MVAALAAVALALALAVPATTAFTPAHRLTATASASRRTVAMAGHREEPDREPGRKPSPFESRRDVLAKGAAVTGPLLGGAGSAFAAAETAEVAKAPAAEPPSVEEQLRQFQLGQQAEQKQVGRGAVWWCVSAAVWCISGGLAV